MKKRVLSALLALCLTLSLAGAAFAENEPPVTTASPAPVTQNLDENNGEPAELNENGEDLDNTEPTGETLDDATDGAQDSDSTGVPEEGNTSDEDNSTSTDEGDSTPAVDSSSEDDSTGTEDENASTPVGRGYRGHGCVRSRPERGCCVWSGDIFLQRNSESPPGSNAHV